MDASELARRIHVAQAYAGFENRPALADAIGEAGLSSANLGRIERGEKAASKRDLRAIAEACGVPEAWLTDDDYDPFTAPVSASELFDRLDRIENQTAQISEGMNLLRGLASEDILEAATQVAQEAHEREMQADEDRRRGSGS